MWCGSLAIVLLLLGISQARKGLGPGDQDWGYVDVREGAHMFYWLYYTTANVSSYTERPLVLWLQGGPGGSSSALGNFKELGPVDTNGEPREGNFVQHVNVLFIDNPVGAGYSYADNTSLIVKNNEELIDDLMSFMLHFYKLHKEFKSVPLHIFTESYGGKMGPALAIRLNEAMKAGDLAEPGVLKSVTMGNPWISTRHICREHSKYLFVNGLIDEDGVAEIDAQEERILSALKKHEFSNATDEYSQWFELMQRLTGGIYLYNTQTHVDPSEDRTYGYGDDLNRFMEQNVSEALHINGSVYASQVFDVLTILHGDRLISDINAIPRLLNETSVKVNIYSAQLDALVPTSATLALIKDWTWNNKSEYLQADRTAIVVDGKLQGYEKVGGNFGMYWINRSGHLAPSDNPTAMQYVLKSVTQYDDSESTDDSGLMQMINLLVQTDKQS
ncbi:retinoid-inducible serine carboxypeptidase [Drosophila ficusphila]|uniref:retinoid-inducible serine carboxypeptidase n=1 Tax=Drosophila ficusphila TaxID=30025 RepID=UPI0007E8ACCB|nr:retinoid-inducible serine carboxypeptidase [Drosophila ficusphila]